MGNITKKFASVAISVATVAMLSGMMPLAAQAQGVTDLQAQINALLAQIQVLQTQLAAGTTVAAPTVSSYSYTRNLTVGSRGEDVTALQTFLHDGGYLSVSPTGYFGSLTKAALAKYQAASGISPAVGFFGAITRAAISAVAVAPGTTPVVPGTTPVVVPSGAGLVVSLAASQPTATIAPPSASRIPFTKINLTAGASDVVVTGVVVERTGLAQDSAFSGIVLVDENGGQVGLAKTLSSDHRATVGESRTIKAGTSVVWTIAANRAAAAALGGQTAALSVVEVKTSAKVTGTFPMIGTTQTVNETLTIGSVTMARGPLDPAAAQTKNIGTSNYIFASMRITAGSAEKLYLKSVRWNQTGSAGSSDLANVKTLVEGDAYDTVVSADGKYYTTLFPGNGILIDKGFSKEVYVRADIIGGSARTAAFDIAKRTDVYLVGETYGYGVVPPQTNSCGAVTGTSCFTSSEDPWYDDAIVTVSSGTLSVTSDSAGVPAQNVALNLASQPMGGWMVDVKGESVSVGTLKFNVFLTDSDAGGEPGLADLTSVTLYNRETGAVLAGPIDGVGATTISGVLTFTDTITFPVGVTKIVMKGKFSATTGFENNDTMAASSTPSTDWTTVTGVTTGVTITPSPTSAVTGNTMTVKGPAVTVSVSTVPIAQTIIAGVSQFTFANYILDLAGSGEDLRLTSFPAEYAVTTGTATDLTNCQMYDGATIVTSGSNVVNPTAAASSTLFTFDGSGLTLPKGTSKSLTLKCDLKAGATGSYMWGYDTSASPSPTGLTSGQSATVTENDSPGQRMTAASGGTLVAALDSGSPSYAVASPGQVVELAKVKFSASNEDVSVKQLALILSGVAASSSAIDLVGQKVDLYDGSTLVGSAVFSSGRNATSSAITNFVVPKDGSKILTIKGTISGVSASGPLTASGDLLRVDYDGANNGVNGNYGTGAASGATVTPGSVTTASNGVRIMKAYPSLAKIDLTSSESTLIAGDDKTMYKFKVTANNGDVAIAKWTFSVSSSTATGSNATTTKFSLYAFSDAGYSTPDANYNSTANPGGLVNAGQCYTGFNTNVAPPATGNLGTGSVLVEVYVDRTGCNLGTTTMIIPAGQTRWFRLAGSVGSLAPSGTSETLQAQLEGDAAFPVGAATLMLPAGTGTGAADNETNDDFIWSPISTTTSNARADLDWTNGYGLPGLPGTNMTPQTLSK